MTGQFDSHMAAIAGVGQAKILDPRARAHEGRLIGDIERALKRDAPRVTAGDVVRAVTEHYDTSGDIVTGDAVCGVLRRIRQAEFRAEQDRRRDYLTDREKAEMVEDWSRIRSWDCPTCGAGYGVWCTNSVTKLPMEHCPGHPARIVLAQRGDAAAQYWLARAEESGHVYVMYPEVNE